MCWIPGVWFSNGSGMGVSPVCRLHDSHGRDARATTLEAQWPDQFPLPDRVPGGGMAKHIQTAMSARSWIEGLVSAEFKPNR